MAIWTKTTAVTLIQQAESREAKGAFLTTDAENNNTVNSFYHSLGWKIESAYETPEGRKMNRYVYDFEEYGT